MSGSRDLAAILAELSIERRPEPYVYANGHSPQLRELADAVIEEGEGTTYIATRSACEEAGAPIAFECAWLTVTVHTALDGVGLTAALSRALADAQIPCNLLAGYHHDHLLVPWDRADDAVAVLEGLRTP